MRRLISLNPLFNFLQQVPLGRSHQSEKQLWRCLIGVNLIDRQNLAVGWFNTSEPCAQPK